MKKSWNQRIALILIFLFVFSTLIPITIVQGSKQSRIDKASKLILDRSDLQLLSKAEKRSSTLEEKALLQLIIREISKSNGLTMQELENLCKPLGYQPFNGKFEVGSGTFLVYPGFICAFFIGYIGPVIYGRWIDGFYQDQWCNGFFIGGLICGRQGLYMDARMWFWFSHFTGWCCVGFYGSRE